MKTSTKQHRRNQQKTNYRIRNWSEYNQALKQRGSLTIWFDMEMIDQWHSLKRTGRQGRPETYSEIAIQCALTLKQVFHLPLRATEGLLESLVVLMKLSLPIPDYSTICRRQKQLSIELPRSYEGSQNHVVVDATGLKVFGEGEWKTRLYGTKKRRTWRKLHLAIDEASQEIVAASVTTNSCQDGELLPDLLEATPDSIQQVSADGAYDSWKNDEL